MLWPVCSAQIKVNAIVSLPNQKGLDVSPITATLWVLFPTETARCPHALGHPASQPHCSKLLASAVILPFSLWVSDETESQASWCSQ